MDKYTEISGEFYWLVTGVAGFIGSHLAQELLLFGQKVVGLDNLSSGKISNIDHIKDNPNFTFIEGDIRDSKICEKACKGVDYILHHAAIGSVKKSIEDPVLVDQVNNGGFINILLAAHKQGVERVVYASSSAIYGEKGDGLRHESELPEPLSPYAVSKCANEHYARALSNTHDIETVGLRYFNIYGSRQDPNGAYAAVIPKWINSMLKCEAIEIFGDGKTMRDFCYVADVVKANILAATSDICKGDSPVYNIASGQSTTLNELFSSIKEAVNYKGDATYKDFRAADIRVSCADISKAQTELGFKPSVTFKDGLAGAVRWYINVI